MAMAEDQEARVAAAREAVRKTRRRIESLDADGIDLLFREARSHYAWSERPVTEADLRGLYEICKFGPTSANGNPVRLVFVRSQVAKIRLAACVTQANVPKLMTAPATVIIAYDPNFWTKLPVLFPHKEMAGHFRDDPKHAQETAFRNSALQGAYLMLAARALGFDVGPMSGFDNAKVDADFLAGTGWRSNFLCNIGHGEETVLFQRLPRPSFDEICRII